MNPSEIIGALGTIASIIVPVLVERYTASKKDKLDGFIQYLNGISDSLKEMVVMLRNGEIPTLAGNKLENDLKEFEGAYRQFKLDDSTLQRFTDAHRALQRNLQDGRFMDDAYRGQILMASDEEKTTLLEKMERTAAEISSLAVKLKLQ